MEKRIALTVEEVRQALGVGRNVAYELVNRADFPKIRVGRKIIIPKEAFYRWVDAQTGVEEQC
ncbi:MAG: helix-turn-helix domain-containing protein [Clostridia bacterium]|nr:helix-turn-helix domain-containing protein [Clostridia bacterium]